MPPGRASSPPYFDCIIAGGLGIENDRRPGSAGADLLRQQDPPDWQMKSPLRLNHRPPAGRPLAAVGRSKDTEGQKSSGFPPARGASHTRAGGKSELLRGLPSRAGFRSCKLAPVCALTGTLEGNPRRLVTDSMNQQITSVLGPPLRSGSGMPVPSSATGTRSLGGGSLWPFIREP